MKFRNEEKESRGCVGWLGAFFAIFGVCVVLGSIGGMFYGFAVRPVIEAEHYRQVWKNPVTVTATVTMHDSYSTEDDTDYRSYVNYVYNNVRYQKIPYEDRDKEEQLTPIGTEVTLQVSPKDPAKPIKELKSDGTMLWFTGVIVSLVLTAACVLLPRLKLSKGCCGTPDMDTVRRDMKIKIRSRMFRPFFLIYGLSCGLMYWRYSMLVGKAMLMIAIVCGVFWLFGLFRAIRDYRCAEKGDFELRHDVLVDKKEIEDLDSSATTYYLYYQNGDQVWHTTTSGSNYRKAQIGDTVVAAYLTGDQMPIVHYTHAGNAK